MSDVAPTVRLVVVTTQQWADELVTWKVLPPLRERFAADVSIEPVSIDWGADEPEAFRKLADVLALAKAERHAIASLWMFDWYDGNLGGGQVSETDRGKCPWLVSRLERPLLHEVIENVVQHDEALAGGTVVFVREPRTLDTNMDRIGSMDQLTSAIANSPGTKIDFSDAIDLAQQVHDELAGAIERTLAAQQQTPLTGPLAGKRVLVVDSDETCRTDAKELLKNYGCQAADTATSGADAVSMVGQAVQSGQAYDVVLADQRLADMTADELLAQLEQIIEGVPFVMMSAFGYDAGHTAGKMRRAGHAVLYKPFHREQLISALADTVAAAASSPAQSAGAALAADGLVRSESRQLSDSGQGEPETSVPQPHLDENVQFTVYRPRTIAPQRWYPLLAFAHLSERPADAPDEPDPVQEVQRQAQRILGAQASAYQDATSDSFQAVPREGEITFVPQMDGVVFNPPRRTFLWQESVHREEFRLKVSPQLNGKTARGRLTVFLGSIVLADVPLAIRVDAAAPAATQQPLAPTAARPYRRIFASYSHQDQHIVEQFERLAITLGDDYLRDWTRLRSGQVWQDELLDMIREADIFQLFWSTRSMSSPYVRKEWEFALSLDREQFVRPLYWEQPLPVNRALDLPPEILTRLHFQWIPSIPSAQLEAVPAAAPADRPESPRRPPPLPAAKRPNVSQDRPRDPSATAEFEKLKSSVCETLVDNLDLSAIGSLDDDQLRREIRQSVEEICRMKSDLMSLSQRERLVNEVLDETLGLGPLELALRDPTVTDIFIHGTAIFIECGGSRRRADVSFRDVAHANQILSRLAARAGRKLDASPQWVDVAFSGGRLAGVLSSGKRPIARITRPLAGYNHLDDWLRRGAISAEMAGLIEAAVRAKMNIAVCGAPAILPAALVKALVGLVGESELVVLLDRSEEVPTIDKDHVVCLSPEPLETSDPGLPTNVLDVVRELRADRIFATELPPEGAWDFLDMLQHECRGSLLAVLAADADHALVRLENWMQRSAPAAAPQSAQRQLAAAIDLIVQVAYSPEADVQVENISELEFTDAGLTLRSVAAHLSAKETSPPAR